VWREESYPDSHKARQRRKARAFCLGVRGAVRLSIQKPLAFDAAEQSGCAFCVVDPEFGTIGIAEIKLGKAAMKVRSET
jgi:hypothetical protein